MRTLLATTFFLTAPTLAQGPEVLAGTDHASGAMPALPAGAMAELGRSLLIDDDGGGTVWAAGPTWKGSFGPDGFTYVPFLGSDAPRNFPVRFTLDSVTAGGEAVAFERAPQAIVEGRTVTLDRDGVREVYHLSETSLEQTFVFDSLPRSGDLVVRMNVQSELAAHADGAGFAFTNERGGMRYGGATGIAADGLRTPLQERLVGDTLEIRVPAEELTPASFPFVVDPIVSTIGVTNDARDQVDVDVSYEATNGVYMIVYEEVQSSNDHDVRSVYYDTNVDLLTHFAAIDISGDNWIDPRVASCAQDEMFLCVATRGVFIGTRDVWGRTREAANGNVGAQFAISTFPGDNSKPDVGGFGDDFDTAFPFLVVWENYLQATDDYDVYGQAVNVNGTLSGSLRAIADSPTDDDRNPQISPSSGSAPLISSQQEYLVAWERQLDAFDRDIWTRVVEYTGETGGHAAWRSYSLGDSRSVTVSSQTRDVLGYEGEAVWVLAFERLRNGVDELFTVVTREGNPDNARSVTTMQDIAVGEHHAAPRIAHDGNGDFTIAYKSQVPGGMNAYITNVSIVRDDGELRTGVSDRREAFVHPAGEAGSLALASTYDGGEPGIDSYVLGLLTAPGAGGDEEVTGTFYRELYWPVDGSQYCQANPNASGESAWIKADHSLNDPTNPLYITVQYLPANSFGYVITSRQSGFSANPGGSAGNLCLSGAIGRLTNEIRNSGASGRAIVGVDLSQIPQPTGNVAAMSGESWHFQYWTRDSAGGVPTSNFSNAIEVNFL